MSKVINCIGGGQVPRLALFLSSLRILEPSFPKTKSKPFEILFTTTHMPNRILIFLVLKSLFNNQTVLAKLSKSCVEEEHLKNAVVLINTFGFVKIAIDPINLLLSINPDYVEDGAQTIILENIRSTRPRPGINNQLFACISMYNSIFEGFISFEGEVGDTSMVITKLQQYDLSLLSKINEINGTIKGMATVTLTCQSLMPLLILIQYHREYDHCSEQSVNPENQTEPQPLPLVVNILGGEFNGLNSPPLIDYLFFLKLLPANVTFQTKKSRIRQKGVISRLHTLNIDHLTPELIPQMVTESSGSDQQVFYSLESRRTKPKKMDGFNGSVCKVLSKVFAGAQVSSYMSNKEFNKDPACIEGTFNGIVRESTPSFTNIIDSVTHREFHDKLIELIKEEYQQEFKRFMLWITVPVNQVPVSLFIEHNPNKRCDIEEFMWFKESVW
jgi:hypothetical protein